MADDERERLMLMARALQIKKSMAAPQTSALEQGTTGLNEGIANMAGFPVDAVTGGINWVGGKFGMDPIQNPVGGSESIKGALGTELPLGLGSFMTDAEPQTAGQRLARRVGQEVGAGAVAGPVAGVSSGLGLAANTAASAVSGLAGGAAKEWGANPIVETIASLLGGGATAAVGGKVAAGRAQRKAIEGVPEVDELKGRAGDLYDDAERNGKTASAAYTSRLQAEVTGIAQKEGMVSPTGRVATSYPKVSEAMKMVEDYAGQKMTPVQMQQVRRIMQGAAQSADATEARIGTQMLKSFDQWTAPIVPEFAEANKTYARAMRGDEIDTAIKVAGTRRSSPDLALRNEFGALERANIRGDLTYPDELADAVKKVAEGSGKSNAALWGSKAAPTGAVSVMGGTVSPFLVGNAFGGPIAGAAAAGTSATAGLVAKLLSTNLSKADARMAAAIARNGGKIPAAASEELRGVIAALLAREAATAGQSSPQ